MPLGTVCFRAIVPGTTTEQDAFNERLLAEINAAGLILISPTRLRDKTVLRLTVGNLRTTEEYLRRAWDLVRTTCARLRAE